MPTEETPVVVRTSAEANRWFREQLNKHDTHNSLRKRQSLFSDAELSTLPYRQQTRPLWPSTNGGSFISNYTVPALRASREIEQEVLQKEIRFMEGAHHDFHEIANRHQRQLLNINRALAVYMAARQL